MRQEWAEQVGRDGFTILEAAFAPGSAGWLREIPAVQVLRRAWVEQYHRDGEGVVHWREGKDLPPARRRLSSPYDSDARYGVKRGSGWCGYKTHLSETCEPNAPHLITLVTARDEYGIELVGPVGLDTCHENHEGEHFTQSAFTIDWQTRKVTCPEGRISASWSDQRKNSGTPITRVHFTAQDCGRCPVREKCTKAANGRWGRSLTLLPRDQQEALEARRREQLTDEWRQRYNIRAGVEGTISQAVRRTRIRRTRYTGLPKTHLGHVFAATAINIIRLDAWLTETPLGPTRTSHLARLDLAA